MSAAVRKAVILSAGMGTRLTATTPHEGPKGFLEIGGRTLIERSLSRLMSAGIEQVIIVTGHMHEWYDSLAADSTGIISTVHNPLYDRSGSMYSLYRARDLIGEDFLLLESDILFEQRALTAVLESETRDCILLSGPSQSHDEVFVQTRRGNLLAMSKNRDDLQQVSGEFVGICKISTPLYQRMVNAAVKMFAKSLKADYESDCIVEVAKQCSIPCRTVFDLIWAEIDDLGHLERAREQVYPQILLHEGVSLGGIARESATARGVPAASGRWRSAS